MQLRAPPPPPGSGPDRSNGNGVAAAVMQMQLTDSVNIGSPGGPAPANPFRNKLLSPLEPAPQQEQQGKEQPTDLLRATPVKEALSDSRRTAGIASSALTAELASATAAASTHPSGAADEVLEINDEGAARRDSFEAPKQQQQQRRSASQSGSEVSLRPRKSREAGDPANEMAQIKETMAPVLRSFRLQLSEVQGSIEKAQEKADKLQVGGPS